MLCISTRSFQRRKPSIIVIRPHMGYGKGGGLFSTCGGQRYRSTVFFSDEKGSAEENVYFKKEDDALLKNLLSSHPEYDPKYASPLLESGALYDDITAVCKKHGFDKPTPAFLHDTQVVFETHGWRQDTTRSMAFSRTKISGRHTNTLME